MPAIQTAYLTNITPTRAGMVPEMVEVDLVSRTNETATLIEFGIPVSQGVRDQGVVPYNGVKLFGITVWDRSTHIGTHFGQYANAKIIRKGPVAVLASVAMNPQDDVYLTSAGAFTNVSAGNVKIPDAKWVTKNNAGTIGWLWIGYGGTSVLPDSRNVGFLGDSRAFLSFTNPGGLNTYKRSLGMAPAIASASVGIFDIPTNIITGVAGYTSQQIRDNLLVPHIAALQAAGANRTFLIGSTNDRSAGTATSVSQANLLYIIAQLNAAGIIVELISETPRGTGSSSYELTAQGKIDHLFMHNWMQGLIGTNPMLFVHNWWDLWLDTASGTNYYVKTTHTEDGIHPSEIGAQAGGALSGPAVVSRLPGTFVSVLPVDATLYNASTAPQGSLIANPLLTGTGGTKESTATAITGVVPAGWTLGAANITGLTLVASQETINGVNYWKLVVTGTGTDTSNPIISLKQAVPTTNMVLGDNIKSVCSVITAGTNISCAGLGFLMVPAYAVKYDTEDSAPSLLYPTANSGRLSRETPIYVREATQTQFELRMESILLKQAAINATFWFGTVKTYKA